MRDQRCRSHACSRIALQRVCDALPLHPGYEITVFPRA
jgi:hypothetical protein